MTKPTLKTDQDFYAACDEIAVHKTALDAAEAERNKRVQAVMDRFEHTIEETKATIKALEKTAETYAKKHRKSLLPGDRKSATTPLAIFGFSKGKPAIKPIGKRTLVDVVTDLVAQGRRSLLRDKTELDKDAAARLTDEELAEVGLRRAQPERFHVEPRKAEERNS